jgi:hypothetical protein
MIDSLLPTINGGLFSGQGHPAALHFDLELEAANGLRKSTFICVLFASGLLRAGSKDEQRQPKSA